MTSDDTRGSLRHQLIRSSILLVGFRGVALALAFGSTVLLARSLGPAGYGSYTLALSIVALLSVPAQLGIPTLVVRDVARAGEPATWGEVRGLLTWAQRLVLAACVTIGIGTLAALYILGAHVGGEFALTLCIALTYLAISSMTVLAQSVLQGLREFLRAQLGESVLLPGLFIGCISVLVFCSGRSVTSALAMALYALCALCCLVVTRYFVTARIGARLAAARPIARRREWLASALPLTVTSALKLANTQVIIVILGMVMSTEAVGLYRVAASLAALAAIIGATLGGLASPYFAAFFARRDLERLFRLALYVAWLGTLPAAAILLGLILAGSALLGRVFGAHFSLAYPALIIMTTAQLVNCATGAVAPLLNMTGHERDTLHGTAFGALVALVAGVTLVPSFGLMGAAIATGMAIAAENLYLLWRVRVRLHARVGVLSGSPV
jgi:O-antigen/teichoic acid export membrane protein